jgi:hypothetical protein
MFMSFHLLETYMKNPSLFFISFYPPPRGNLYFFFTHPPRGKRRWQPQSARIYTRGKVRFAKFLFTKLATTIRAHIYICAGADLQCFIGVYRGRLTPITS